MKQTKRFCLALAAMLLGIGSTWATAVYPTSDILFRPKYQTDHWVWDSNTYPKLSTTQGATIFECKWSSKMFAIQQYEIPDFANVKTIKLTLATTDNTKGDLSVWDFPYEFPVSTKDDGPKRQQFVANVESVTGVKMDETSGSFQNMLDTAKYANNAWTFLIDASKLTPISYKEDGTTAVINLLITSRTPSQGTAGKYSSNNSANAENVRPSLVVTEELQDLSLPVNEYNYRFEADGSKWKYKTKTTGASATEMELNYFKNFCVIEQFYIKDFDKSKMYTLKLYIRAAKSAQAYNFQDYKHDTITATYLKQEVEKIVGITMAATSGTANNPISTCSRNESSDLTLTIPGSSLNVLYTDSRGYSVVNLLLTNISSNLTADNSLKIYTSSKTDKQPAFACAGFANVYNETKQLAYDDLQSACTAAAAGDTICINNNLTTSVRIEITKNPVTIYGRTADTKINFTTRGAFMFLVKDYSTTSIQTTIKNLQLVNDATQARDQIGIEVNKPTTIENVTFVSEAGYNTGKFDVYAKQANLVLVGNNVLPGGIKIANGKRVDDGISGASPRTTHTTPIVLTMETIAENTMVVAHGWGTRKDMYQLTNEGYMLYVNDGNGDLKAFQVQPITLAETADNAALLSKYKGIETSITLARTIAASTSAYSTFCVPFETTKSELGAAEVLAYTGATIVGEEATLNFEDVETLEAGKPYLVRFDAEYKDPVFTGKTITAATAGKYGDGNYEFTGLFSQTVIAETQTKEKIYLGPSNQLYWAGNNCTVGGLRGYFQAVSPSAVAARCMTIGRNTPTGMESATYNLQPATSKVLRNGQLFIERNGVLYNANGQMVK